MLFLCFFVSLFLFFVSCLCCLCVCVFASFGFWKNWVKDGLSEEEGRRNSLLRRVPTNSSVESFHVSRFTFQLNLPLCTVFNVSLSLSLSLSLCSVLFCSVLFFFVFLFVFCVCCVCVVCVFVLCCPLCCKQKKIKKKWN